jgi:hypothetical protein
MGYVGVWRVRWSGGSGIYLYRYAHGFFSGIPRKSGVLQGSLDLSRESLGNWIFPLFQKKENAGMHLGYSTSLLRITHLGKFTSLLRITHLGSLSCCFVVFLFFVFLCFVTIARVRGCLYIYTQIYT